MEAAAKRVRKRVEEVRKEVRMTVDHLLKAMPRPLEERPTIFLREPLIKRLRERIEEKKRLKLRK